MPAIIIKFLPKMLRASLASFLFFGFIPTLLYAQSHPKAITELKLDSIKELNLHYYYVTGDTLEAIRNFINQRGPVESTGRKRHALTKWRIRWKWVKKQGTDRIVDMETNYNIDLYFPFLRDLGEKRPEVREEWQRYSLALAKHELGHIELFLKEYGNIKGALSRLVKENGPLEYAEAKAITKTIIDRMHEADKEYDQATNHGLKDGVHFRIQ